MVAFDFWLFFSLSFSFPFGLCRAGTGVKANVSCFQARRASWLPRRIRALCLLSLRTDSSNVTGAAGSVYKHSQGARRSWTRHRRALLSGSQSPHRQRLHISPPPAAAVLAGRLPRPSGLSLSSRLLRVCRFALAFTPSLRSVLCRLPIFPFVSSVRLWPPPPPRRQTRISSSKSAARRGVRPSM